MMLASLVIAAALGGQDALPAPSLRPQDRRADCPAWLRSAMASNEPGQAPGTCIWTDTSDEAQAHYVDQLERAGWRSTGGLANVLKFRKGDTCVGLAGFPTALPHDEAIGSDRDLNQPRPADEPAVFLILPDPEACASVGDH